MATANREFDQRDKDIKDRDRASRTLVVIASLLLATLGCYFLGSWLGKFFRLPGTNTPMVLGLGLAGLTTILLLPRLFVYNYAVSAFMTIDLLTDEHVSYGPGLHPSFPWEARDAANNINLDEVPEKYVHEIILKDGKIQLEISARLRPDITMIPVFISGVGSAAEDLGGIITSNLTAYYTKTDMGVQEARRSSDPVNEHLEQTFQHGIGDTSEFERRFGLIVGDVTVGGIKVTAEVEETIGALTESRIIDQIVAESYGCETMKQIEEKIARGELDREDVNRRRTQAMAMSGNLQGMGLTESTTNFRLQGLDKVDPALATAIASLAPALNALFAKGPGRGQSSNTKTK